MSLPCMDRQADGPIDQLTDREKHVLNAWDYFALKQSLAKFLPFKTNFSSQIN